MKKILYVVTSDSFMKAFNLPYLRWFKENGYEVHVAYENRFNYAIPHCDKIIDLPFKRNPFHPANYQAYKRIKALIREHRYELIHCHTPIPAAITRLAAAGSRKQGSKVLYTAHGFHFYKGASIKNWAMYYSAEKALSYVTDGIVTINKDDYQFAKERLASSKIFLIPGVGVDVKKYQPQTGLARQQLRQKLQFREEQFVLLYIAEFIPRKDHRFLLDLLPGLCQRIPGVKLVFAGRGVLLEQMKNLVQEKGISSYVEFLGFRQDLDQVIPASDVSISCSRQEGLGLGVAEGMMCSIPVVASRIRGHADLVDDGQNGYLYGLDDQSAFIESIVKLYEDPNLRERMGQAAYEKVQTFSLESSLIAMDKIYREILTNNI